MVKLYVYPAALSDRRLPHTTTFRTKGRFRRTKAIYIMKIIKRAIAAWTAAVLIATVLTGLRSGSSASLLTPEFASGTSLILYAGLFVSAFLLLTALQTAIVSHGAGARISAGAGRLCFDSDNAALLFSVNLLALIALRFSSDITLLLGLLVPVVITDIYIALDSSDRLTLPQSKRLFLILALVFGAAQAVFIALFTCARYLNYSSPCYDFGIFCNMFASMARDFTQTVSCERDAIIQHFAVHFSPIYYLMLPFYFVFRSPLTLQILQAVIVGSGVIPLYFIARRRRLTPPLSAALCLAYALYPALTGGCSYDLHENCFLAPLLLWLFYFSEQEGKKSRILTALFAILTLAVKEDAAVYVAFFGIYKLISDGHDGIPAPDGVSVHDGKPEQGGTTEPKNGSAEKLPLSRRIRSASDSFFTHGRRRGLALLLGSVAWFLFTSWFLSSFGYGIMSYRYDNFMTDGGSLVGVIINVLKNPVLVFSESFEAEKLTFLAQALLPLALLPLVTRRPHRLLLLCPLLLIGLMSDYQYQHSIYFQYVFGWSAFLFYAAALNLSDLGKRARRALCAVMLSASALFFSDYALPLGSAINPNGAVRAKCEAINEAITVIPDDASVTSDTFILPHLADREIIYQLDDNATSADTDYVVLDIRAISSTEADKREQAFIADGYETVCRTDGAVIIMKR